MKGQHLNNTTNLLYFQNLSNSTESFDSWVWVIKVRVPRPQNWSKLWTHSIFTIKNRSPYSAHWFI